jgi:hypothetical protein
MKLPTGDTSTNEYHPKLELGALVGFATDRGHRSRALERNILKSAAGKIVVEQFIHGARPGGSE